MLEECNEKIKFKAKLNLNIKEPITLTGEQYDFISSYGWEIFDCNYELEYKKISWWKFWLKRHWYFKEKTTTVEDEIIKIMSDEMAKTIDDKILKSNMRK